MTVEELAARIIALGHVVTLAEKAQLANELNRGSDPRRTTSTIAQGLYFAEAMDVASATGLLQVGSIDPSSTVPGAGESFGNKPVSPAKALATRSSGKR